ncbi:hypothetical protein PAMA_018249 [Pampus argenteus]
MEMLKPPHEDLKDQLLRSQKNEKLLMNKVRELTRQRANLIKADIDLKKEQLEVVKLKKTLSKQGLNVDQLRKDLIKTKTDLRNLETEKTWEKNTSEDRICSLEKKCRELTNKYSVENEIRKQREREMEKLPTINEHKKLTEKLEDISHQWQELIGYRSFAEKKIEELNQLVKYKDTEHNKTKALLANVKTDAKQVNDLKEEISYYEDKLQSEQKEKAKVVRDITEHQKQAESDKKTIYHLMINIDILKKENLEYNDTKSKLEQQIEIMGHNETALALEIENQNKEALKQRSLIRSLEHELNNFSNKNKKLEQRLKDTYVNIKKKDEMIVNDRRLIAELQNTLALQTKHIDDEKLVKFQTLQGIAKDKVELEGNTKTIQRLNDEIRTNGDVIGKKDMELEQLKEKYNTKKKQIERLKKTRANLEQKLQDITVSTSKENEWEKEQNAKMTEEMARYEKEIILYKEMVLQQQIKTDSQVDANRKLEQEFKDYKEQTKFITNQLLKKENELDEANLSLQMMFQNTDYILLNIHKAKTRDTNKKVPPRLQKPRQYQLSARKLVSYQWKGKIKYMQTQLEENDKKIHELKAMLARRPDDAIHKLHESRWNNRELHKKLKASQGRAMAYEAQYKHVAEENNKLTNEIRKLKLASTARSKYGCLPPISKKSQSPPENKPGDQCESEKTSERVHFKYMKHQCPSNNESESEVVPLPPVSINIDRCILMPHPPLHPRPPRK